MIRIAAIASVLFTGIAATAHGQEMVTATGSSRQYPTKVETSIADKKVSLNLTGAVLRKRAFFSVYTVGSYVQGGTNIKTADQLAGADTVKQLHIIMERDVSGQDMAKAFRDAIMAAYPDNRFAAELSQLCALLEAHPVAKNDEIWITHFPGYGIYCNLVGKKTQWIKGLPFAKAVWDIYLGPKCINESIKAALISRL
jgi:hypothetical protein